MKSIHEDLWYGNIAPWENCGVGDEEMELLVKLMVENEKTLREKLREENKLLFSKYVQWTEQYASHISAQAFQEGFILAAQIFMAVQKREWKTAASGEAAVCVYWDYFRPISSRTWRKHSTAKSRSSLV